MGDFADEELDESMNEESDDDMEEDDEESEESEDEDEESEDEDEESEDEDEESEDEDEDSEDDEEESEDDEEESEDDLDTSDAGEARQERRKQKPHRLRLRDELLKEKVRREKGGEDQRHRLMYEGDDGNGFKGTAEDESRRRSGSTKNRRRIIDRHRQEVNSIDGE